MLRISGAQLPQLQRRERGSPSIPCACPRGSLEQSPLRCVDQFHPQRQFAARHLFVPFASFTRCCVPTHVCPLGVHSFAMGPSTRSPPPPRPPSPPVVVNHERRHPHCPLVCTPLVAMGWTCNRGTTPFAHVRMELILSGWGVGDKSTASGTKLIANAACKTEERQRVVFAGPTCRPSRGRGCRGGDL